MAYVGSCNSNELICVVGKIFFYFIFLTIEFEHFNSIKKYYGTHQGNQYIFLACAANCDSGAKFCCSTNNCNKIDTDISIGTAFAVKLCYEEGNIPLLDSPNGGYCPALSSSHCGVRLNVK